MKELNKKGQFSVGMVTPIVMAITALIIGVIIALVIVQTLGTAELMTSTRNTTTVVNEYNAWINATPYTLKHYNSNVRGIAISVIKNATTYAAGSYNYTILSANYTVSSAGVLSNITTRNWDNVSINYTYQSLSPEELTTDAMNTNLSSGINEVSAKIPTVLLVAAIVLILGILAVLVGVWQKMRMGGGSI